MTDFETWLYDFGYDVIFQSDGVEEFMAIYTI